MRTLVVLSLAAVLSYLQSCSSEKASQYGNLKKRENASSNSSNITSSHSIEKLDTIEFDRMIDYEPVSPLYLRQGGSDLEGSYEPSSYQAQPKPTEFGGAEPMGQRYPSQVVGNREPAYLPSYESVFVNPPRPLYLNQERPLLPRDPVQYMYPIQPERMVLPPERPAVHLESMYRPESQERPVPVMVSRESDEGKREEERARIVNEASKKAREEYARLTGARSGSNDMDYRYYEQSAMRAMHQYGPEPHPAQYGEYKAMYPDYGH
jgi:hypothetical protein